jgi:hypothetical protein
MAQDQTSFSDRLRRIDESRGAGSARRSRKRRAEPVAAIVHPDGFSERIAGPKRRLRFGFPLKGVAIACALTVVVKAYLIWTLGGDVYGAAVAQLLGGSQFERAAGLILAPDLVSLWLVDAYQYLYRVVMSVGMTP